MSRYALTSFVLRRLAALCVLLVLISFAVFSLLYIAPGTPVDVLLAGQPTDEQTIQQLRHEYNLDEPFFAQYWTWAKDAAQLDFGESIQTRLPVTDEIKARLPTTLFLGVYAFVLTMVLGVGLGVLAAVKRRKAADRGIVAGALVGVSTPGFVSGVLLLYLFAIVLPWFPAFGQGDGFADQLWHLTLPAVALATVVSALIVKHTRAAMINVLDQDYVTFARARGLSSNRILFAYTLRNALIPVVTVSALTLAFVITGAVLVEVTFSLKGLGSLLVESANFQDLPMIQGVAMLVAAVVMAANLVADVVYVAVDPRIRLGRGDA